MASGVTVSSSLTEVSNRSATAANSVTTYNGTSSSSTGGTSSSSQSTTTESFDVGSLATSSTSSTPSSGNDIVAPVENMIEDYENTKGEELNWFQKAVDATGAFFSNAVSTAVDVVKDAAETVKDTVFSNVLGGLETLFEPFEGIVDAITTKDSETGKSPLDYFEDVLTSVGATLATVVTSVVEGLGIVGEGIIDTGCFLFGSVIALPFYIGDLVFGTNDGEGFTQSIQEFIQTEHVKDMFNTIYDKTGLKEHSYIFDLVRGVGNTVGEVVGIIAGGKGLSGITELSTNASLATTAGVVGFGEGTEDAWNNGADYGRGLLSGGFNAVLSALRWYVGGKIAGSNPFSNPNQLDTLYEIIGNGSWRTTFYAIEGAFFSLLEPVKSVISEDKSYNEAFEDAGGVKSVVRNTLMGLIIGGSFEAIRIFKYINRNKADLFFSKHGDGEYGNNQNVLSRASSSGEMIEVTTNRPNLITDRAQFQESLRKYTNIGDNEKAVDALMDAINSGKSLKHPGLYNALEDYYCRTSGSYVDAMTRFRQDFTFNVTPEFQPLVNKYVAQGMSPEEALRMLSNMNSIGVCSYASKADCIMYSYRGNEAQFKADFGFDMYKPDGSLNTEELLADMYVFANSSENGGQLFTRMPDGSLSVNIQNPTPSDYSNQQYFSFLQHDNEYLMDSYLNSKNPNLNYNTLMVGGQGPRSGASGNITTESVTKTINQGLKGGGSVELIYNPLTPGKELLLHLEDGSVTAIKGCHAMRITGIQGDRIIISTWGYRGYVEASDLVSVDSEFTLYSESIGGVGK